jgi:hypothetical protein
MKLIQLDLNLDLFGMPDDNNTQMAVFLIIADLKTRKLINALTSIGCDACFCMSDLFSLVFIFVGFTHLTDQLTDFYFELLDKYCDNVSHEKTMPIKEAIMIYQELKSWKQKSVKARV